MLADAEYFNLRISKLDGAGDLGDHIVNLIRAKTVASEAGAAKRPSIEKQLTEPEQDTPAHGPAETEAT